MSEIAHVEPVLHRHGPIEVELFADLRFHRGGGGEPFNNVVTASPGTTRITKNESAVAPMRTGMPVSNRRRMNGSTGDYCSTQAS